MTVIKGNTVTTDEDYIKPLLSELYTYKQDSVKGNMVFTIKDKYYIYNVRTSAYTIIDSVYKEYLVFFSHLVTPVEEEYLLPDPLVEHKFISKHKPRANQSVFINAILNNKKRVIIEARPGYGKTFIALYALSKLKYRTIIYIKPTIIPKWINDLHEHFDIKDDEIYVIQSRATLLKLFNMDYKKIKFVIASNATMYYYFKEYNSSLKTDLLPPNQLLEKLNISCMLSDESHTMFYNLYMAVLNLNPKYLIGLSGTFVTDDTRLRKFHTHIFPKESRINIDDYDNHIKFIALHYNLKLLGDSKTKYGYNHKLYEKKILTVPYNKQIYLKIIKDTVEKYYIKRKEEGNKCLIYCSSLLMVDEVYKYLKLQYPELDIRIFKGGSPYKDALEPDIRVSHPQVLKEAIDIKGLITIVNTVNQNSKASNLQMLERLRYIPNKDTIFIQFVNNYITKHRFYLNKMLGYMKTITKQIRRVDYDKHNF
jgi:hypothetical protein